MTDTISFKNHFLIAMPNLADPNFFHSVTYLCEHNNEGAMGIIINHPLDISISDLLTHMEIKHNNKALQTQTVLSGGPVQQERGFVLHRPVGQWQSTLLASPTINITTSKDILEAIGNNKGPSEIVMALGYAGWEAGQLETEIASNTWLTCPADAKILFETAIADRWQAAASLLGFDLQQLSNDIGHA